MYTCRVHWVCECECVVRFLGNSAPIVYSGSYPFGQGDQALLVGGFQCLGTEATWDACTYATTTCGHHEEAHVDCNGPCTSDTIRLVNSSGTGGRVQYCFNQQWGSIGGQGWSQNDAKVTCQQLGYSQYSKISTSHHLQMRSQ